MNIDEVINGWTFEETIKTAKSLMEAETNMFKWDVIRHLRDFAKAYRELLKEYQQLEEQGRLIKLPIEDKKGDCRECVHTKTQCHHMEYKCSECPLTELFCDEFYLAIDRCYEDAYASGCLAGMDLAKSEAEAKLKELRGRENESSNLERKGGENADT